MSHVTHSKVTGLHFSVLFHLFTQLVVASCMFHLNCENMAIFAVLFITVFSVSLMPMLCTFSNLLPKSHFFHYTWSIPVMAAKGRFYLANIHF